ncbi:Ppx/GppA family phosphatase [Mesorhizobium sp. RP14(2022)]|uniref:Ppx/GppA family phosphatase n=1 Tax=Mesorhizobium liriopis TaxID=2953882 RepID=A0ABT1C2M1_9HYPH|nr:Ppx/GppA phosphatase family protein [Mesorhizobium liriopis]MCO6049064.1 Ppx/GppA family phosphatase [Mesorhizobium liriopis]
MVQGGSPAKVSPTDDVAAPAASFLLEKSSTRLARRRKENDVGDREPGRFRPAAEGLESDPPLSRGGFRPGRKHRRAKPKQAAQRLAQAHEPAPDGAPGSTPTRKRRKRRRGRKAFVRVPGLETIIAISAEEALAKGAAPLFVVPPAVTGAAPLAAVLAAEPTLPPHPDVSGFARRRHDLPVFAALDLGTNNCRLLVAVPARPGQFRVVDAFSRIVRLGEGLGATGALGERAMDRAVEALIVCGEKLRARPILRTRLIATEACRAASNGEAFLDRVEREAGIRLEIISRETEARLAVSGCGSLVEQDAKGVVLFDIGGGSTEIALVDLSRSRAPRLADSISAWTSLPIGVVTLAEKFGGRDVTPESFKAMTAHVAAMIERFEGRDRLAKLAGDDRLTLLGTSGTVTTLAGIHLDLPRYDRRRVDGLWMESDEVDRMTAKLLGWDFDRRVANPCIGPDRADLVLAGCAILEAIRAEWPTKRLRVADRGLREGMLSELMSEAGVWRNHHRRPRAHA